MRIIVSAPCLFALAFLSAMGCDISTSGPEPTPLRLDSPQRRAVVQQTANKATFRVLGESFDQAYDEDLRYTLDIDAAGPDGTAAFTATLDFFSLDMESSLFEDSGGGMDPTAMMIRPVNEALRAARGLSYTGNVSSDGHVHGLDGLDKLQEEVHKKLATRTLPVELTGTTVMEEVVEEIFGEDSTTLTLEQILLPRPLEPLTEDYTWMGTTEISFGVADLPAAVTFAVVSIAEDKIVVGENVTFAIDAAGEQAIRESLSPNTPFKVEVTGHGSGSYQVDPATGWVTKYTQTLLVIGKYDFDGVVMSFTTNVKRSFETFSD